MLLFSVLFCFPGRVLVAQLAWPQIHFVTKAGLELKIPLPYSG